MNGHGKRCDRSQKILARAVGGAVTQSRVRIISPPTLQPICINDFLALEIPPREMLLGPIMPEKSLAMLYAPRGLGKSWLALSMAVAVATGGRLMRWEATKPRRVLILDGEMPLSDLQARLSAILLGAGVAVPNDNLQNRHSVPENGTTSFRIRSCANHEQRWV
jgi:Mrp family chromosome partitioning ATPase